MSRKEELDYLRENPDISRYVRMYIVEKDVNNHKSYYGRKGHDPTDQDKWLFFYHMESKAYRSASGAKNRAQLLHDEDDNATYFLRPCLLCYRNNEHGCERPHSIKFLSPCPVIFSGQGDQGEIQ